MNKAHKNNSCLVTTTPHIKHIPFGKTAHKWFSLATLATSLLMTSCSTPQKNTPEASQTPKTPAVEITPIEPPEEIVSINPEAERIQALRNGDWWTYLHFSNELWLEADAQRQAQIEQQVWQQIRFLDSTTLKAIQQKTQIDQPADNIANIQAWAELALMTEAKGFKQLAFRQNLQTFHQDAPFHKHIFRQILQQLPKAKTPKTVAVLLPESGKFQVVGEFIKQGIIKSYFAYPNSSEPVSLKFYDSADLNNIIPLYYQAKQEGAEFIIGPVQQEAIELLSGMDDDKLLALNAIDQATVFAQFNFKTDPIQNRLLAALEAQNITTLGVLSSNTPKQLSQLNSIRRDWSQQENTHFVSKTYDDTALKYREALGKLLNEINSRERKNTLRWIVGKPLHYFPRVRQDLDAILMLDDAHRLAVFNPQFDFFQLKIPIFGARNLQVTTRKDLEPNPDLKGIRVLNPPFALHPENLTNLFEAFGWDSYLLAMQMHQLKTGGCLSSAQTGILSVNGNQIEPELVWTQYSPNGELKPYIFSPSKTLNLPNQKNQTSVLNGNNPQEQTPPVLKPLQNLQKSRQE